MAVIVQDPTAEPTRRNNPLLMSKRIRKNLSAKLAHELSNHFTNNYPTENQNNKIEANLKIINRLSPKTIKFNTNFYRFQRNKITAIMTL